MTKTPVAYFLIGVPASGKSTWVATQPFDWNRTVIVSSDNYIERKAQELGKTYNDVFSDHVKAATTHMNATVADAVSKNLDIVWDQTNTSAKARKGKLAMIPSHYKKIAVFFPTPADAEHNRRLLSRQGKTIPSNVMASMKQTLEIPTTAEGFDEIWRT